MSTRIDVDYELERAGLSQEQQVLLAVPRTNEVGLSNRVHVAYVVLADARIDEAVYGFDASSQARHAEKVASQAWNDLAQFMAAERVKKASHAPQESG